LVPQCTNHGIITCERARVYTHIYGFVVCVYVCVYYWFGRLIINYDVNHLQRAVRLQWKICYCESILRYPDKTPILLLFCNKTSIMTIDFEHSLIHTFIEVYFYIGTLTIINTVDNLSSFLMWINKNTYKLVFLSSNIRLIAAVHGSKDLLSWDQVLNVGTPYNHKYSSDVFIRT
jgi:hypothetical protein